MKILKRIKWLTTLIIYLSIYYVCFIIVKVFRINNDNVWLISERGDEAKDNGYAFYKYMIDNHDDIVVKYIITKKSLDYEKIRKKDVVLYRSFKHYIYYITSKYLISTHLRGTSPNHRAFGSLASKGLLRNRRQTGFFTAWNNISLYFVFAKGTKS